MFWIETHIAKTDIAIGSRDMSAFVIDHRLLTGDDQRECKMKKEDTCYDTEGMFFQKIHKRRYEKLGENNNMEIPAFAGRSVPVDTFSVRSRGKSRYFFCQTSIVVEHEQDTWATDDGVALDDHNIGCVISEKICRVGVNGKREMIIVPSFIYKNVFFHIWR